MQLLKDLKEKTGNWDFLFYLSNTRTIYTNNHLLAYTVHLLDKYSKILQTAQYVHQERILGFEKGSSTWHYMENSHCGWLWASRKKDCGKNDISKIRAYSRNDMRLHIY